MSIRKPAIPPVPRTPDRSRDQFDRSIKETLETLTGVRAGRIEPLPDNATAAEVLAKLNEVIARLQ